MYVIIDRKTTSTTSWTYYFNWDGASTSDKRPDKWHSMASISAARFQNIFLALEMESKDACWNKFVNSSLLPGIIVGQEQEINTAKGYWNCKPPFLKKKVAGIHMINVTLSKLKINENTWMCCLLSLYIRAVTTSV